MVPRSNRSQSTEPAEMRQLLPTVHVRSLFLATIGIAPLIAPWAHPGPVAAGPPAAAPVAAVELRIREPRTSSPKPAGNPYRQLEGPLSGLEERLFADAADGQWNEHSILAAALVASGVEDQRSLDDYLARVATLVDELARSGELTGTARQRAQAILEFLHRRILHGGYQIDCTDLRVALDEGRFNCVSASLLFHCIANQFGLHVEGLEAPGHAMSRLVLPDEVLDVETTCPTWFRLLDDPKRQAAMVDKALGLSQPRSKSTAERRVVSAVELVATIYYNRGVDLLGQREFASAVAANARALRLDPLNHTAEGNLLASLNNWAIAMGGAGRYPEAVRILDLGLSLDAAYPTFKTNYVHVYHQWISELLAKGEREEARLIAEQALADPFLAGEVRAAIPELSAE